MLLTFQERERFYFFTSFSKGLWFIKSRIFCKVVVWYFQCFGEKAWWEWRSHCWTITNGPVHRHQWSCLICLVKIFTFFFVPYSVLQNRSFIFQSLIRAFVDQLSASGIDNHHSSFIFTDGESLMRYLVCSVSGRWCQKWCLRYDRVRPAKCIPLDFHGRNYSPDIRHASMFMPNHA